MKIMGKMSLALVIRLMTDVIFALNVAALLFLPFGLLRYFYNLLHTTYLTGESYNFLLPFFYVCGTLTLGVLAVGHLILRSLERNCPFDRKNPLWFRFLAIDLAVLSLVLFGKMFVYPTILTLLGAYLILLVALLAMILSEIFRQACKIWEENELTI